MSVWGKIAGIAAGYAIGGVPGALVGGLIVTCIVSSGTPGPNNLIVLSATLSDTRRAALKAYLVSRRTLPLMQPSRRNLVRESESNPRPLPASTLTHHRPQGARC